jgi:Lar family restriction alleviation protein
MSEALKSCPFCGSEDLELDNLVDADDFYVSCRKCQVQQIANYTKEEAARRWNTRSLETEMGMMLLSIFSHVSHGGPTREEGEALLKKAGLI